MAVGFAPGAPSRYFIAGLSNLSWSIKETMSRILEALKRTPQVPTEEPHPKPAATESAGMADRRRSRRKPFDITVYVYGHGAGDEPFHEEAHTLNVNANGALLLLSVPVRKGQSLLLTNQLTEREQECQVIFLGNHYTRTVETGVAFVRSDPEFWRLHISSELDRAASRARI
jgi:hypothetical protein